MLDRALRRLLRVGDNRQIAIVLRTALGRVVPGASRPKVFAVGYNKTATSSLHHVFETLGYVSYHGVAWRNTDNLSIFYKFDAFSDGVPKDFAKLDRVFPGSKFILQVRALDAWIDSRIEHIRRENQRRAATGAAPRPEPDVAMIQSWVVERDRHHRAVMAHFKDRPQDLLVVNFIDDPDAATRVAGFLGHDGPMAKPHANRGSNSDAALTHGALIATALEGLGVPKDAWSADIVALPG